MLTLGDALYHPLMLGRFDIVGETTRYVDSISGPPLHGAQAHYDHIMIFGAFHSHVATTPVFIHL